MSLAQEFMQRAVTRIKSRHEMLSEQERNIAMLEERFIDQIGKPGRDAEKLSIAEELVGLLKISTMMAELPDAIVCGKCKERTVVPTMGGGSACYKCNPEELIEE